MPECVRCGDYTSNGYTHWCERSSDKETVYADLPDEPQGAMFAPGGNYGPHLREFVHWLECGGHYFGMWRGWTIRVYPQTDSYQGKIVVRWYAVVNGRQRVHACGTKERAMNLACAWVDAEIFND